MCERDILGNESGRVNQDALVSTLAAFLLADDELLDFGVQLLAREETGLDGVPEVFLEHIELPAVDDDLVHLRPAGRIELAACKGNESGAGFQPGLTAHD